MQEEKTYRAAIYARVAREEPERGDSHAGMEETAAMPAGHAAGDGWRKGGPVHAGRKDL